jgi:hypothetical protein
VTAGLGTSKVGVNVVGENTSQLTTDDDLKPLHDDPRFQALLDEIQRKQPVASK